MIQFSCHRSFVAILFCIEMFQHMYSAPETVSLILIASPAVITALRTVSSPNLLKYVIAPICRKVEALVAFKSNQLAIRVIGQCLHLEISSNAKWRDILQQNNSAALEIPASKRRDGIQADVLRNLCDNRIIYSTRLASLVVA
jgi:hypothetical protein